MEDEVILLKIEVDQSEVKKEVEAARAQLARLRAEEAAVKEERKKGIITAKEYSDSMKAIKGHIATVTKTLEDGEKTMAEYAKTEQLATKSLNQMRTSLSLFNSVQDQYVKESLAVLEQLETLTDQLKVEDAALKSTATSMDKLDDVINELETAYRGLSQAQREDAEVGGKLLATLNDLYHQQEKNQRVIDNSRKGIREYIRDINVLGINIGKTVDSFKSGAQGVGTFVKGLFTARGALVALTAVPIVLVLTAIVNFFTRSKEGMEFFGSKLAGLTAVLDLFLTKMVNLGKAIVTAFESPELAIKKLGQLILENLTNRLTAIGVILRGDLLDGFAQLLTGVENASGKISKLTAEAKQAAAAGAAIAKEAYAIADAERVLGVQRAKSRAQVEELKQIGDDVTKSNQQRLAATTRAYAIEQNLLDQQLVLQQRKIDNIKAENALRPESTEGVNNLAEAEKRLYELTEESKTRQIELNNKLNQIRLDSQRQAAALLVSNAERALTIAKESGKKTYLELFDLEKDYLDKKLALDLVGVIKGSEAELTLRQKYQSDLAALNLSATASEQERLDAVRLAELKRRITQVKAQSEEEFNLRKGILQQEYLQEVHAANDTIKNKEQLNQKLLELDAQYAKDLDTLNQEQRQAELAKEQAHLDKRLAQTRAGSDAEYRVLKEKRAKALQQELDDVTKTEEQKEAIREQYRRADADAQKDHVQSIIDKTVEALNQSTATLSSFIDASVARQTAALDSQYEEVLKSAALTSEGRERIEREYQKKKDALEKAAAEKRRKLASIENIINTAVSVQKAFATAGPIVGAILAALALAKGIAQQTIIDNAKFAKGGVVDGPSHSQGGVKFRLGNRTVELEGGEAVINKRSTAKYYQQLSAMNADNGWGRPFARIVTQPPIFNVAYAVPKPITPMFAYGVGNVSSGLAQGIDQRQLAATIQASVSQAVKEGMAGFKIYTAITDVRKADKQYTDAVATGDV